jgi:SAM-dependent methyltransferase
MGYRMVLVDLSPEMIRHCREQVERRGLSDRVLGYHALDICDMHDLSEASFDLLLALGAPLGLCRDPQMAVREFHRVIRPGGYVVCDMANRYRTALDLVRDKEMGQVASLLDTGRFSRPDGLSDYRFTPEELPHLFTANGFQPRHLAAFCPFFDFLPTSDQVRILDDEGAYETMLGVGERYAEDGAVISLSGRLLVVAEKGA